MSEPTAKTDPVCVVLHPSEANIEAKELSLMASLTAESTRLMAEKFSLVSVDVRLQTRVLITMPSHAS